MDRIRHQSTHYLNLQEARIDFFFQEVDDYMPEGMDKKLENYMRSHHIGPKHAIPLWNPSRVLGANVRRRVRLDVGDVGTFTRQGGFQVAFNILMNEKLNILCDYDVPENFSPFNPPLTPEQRKRCSIKDDRITIDLDDCGAIVCEKYGCTVGALSDGFVKERCESSET